MSFKINVRGPLRATPFRWVEVTDGTVYDLADRDGWNASIEEVWEGSKESNRVSKRIRRNLGAVAEHVLERFSSPTFLDDLRRAYQDDSKQDELYLLMDEAQGYRNRIAALEQEYETGKLGDDPKRFARMLAHMEAALGGSSVLGLQQMPLGTATCAVPSGFDHPLLAWFLDGGLAELGSNILHELWIRLVERLVLPTTDLLRVRQVLFAHCGCHLLADRQRIQQAPYLAAAIAFLKPSPNGSGSSYSCTPK
jgi:hypothetical protein